MFWTGTGTQLHRVKQVQDKQVTHLKTIFPSNVASFLLPFITTLHVFIECVCVCVHARVCARACVVTRCLCIFMWVWVHVEVRRWRRVSSIAFCLVFWDKSFSLSLKLLDSTMIAGSQVLGILLPRFCPRAGVIDTCHYVWLFMWVLRHKLRSLFLYSWHLWPSHLPSLLIALFPPKNLVSHTFLRLFLCEICFLKFFAVV